MHRYIIGAVIALLTREVIHRGRVIAHLEGIAFSHNQACECDECDPVVAIPDQRGYVAHTSRMEH